MPTLKFLRSAIDAVPRRGRGRRFPAALKVAVARYVIAARARGERAAVLESDLGVSWETLRRWVAELEDGADARALVPVTVVDVVEPSPLSRTLVSPSGWRVEGLSLEDVRSLVSA